MGYSYDKSDGPQQCFNAAKMWQLGWFSSRTKQLGASGLRRYSGEIADMTDTDASGPPIVIKMNTPGSKDYFLNFNRATGFNMDTIDGANNVRIVQTNQGSGTAYSKSYLMASLSSGQSWTSTSDFDGETVTVRVISIGDTANVDICIGSCPKPTASPTPGASEECVDYKGKIVFLNRNGKRLTRSCWWVANEFTPYRCSFAGVSAACPVTCGTCGTRRCEDPNPTLFFKFVKGSQIIGMNCEWVSEKQTGRRCRFMKKVCRDSCGVCTK